MTEIAMNICDPGPFRPHPLIRGGHAQTLAAAWWPRRTPPAANQVHLVQVADGDVIAISENRPEPERDTGAGVLLVHGLCGCHGSSYMVRMASKLVAMGCAAYRLDLRGRGAGAGKARWPYHAGRWDDVRDAVAYLLGREPTRRLSLAGFSLGGNIVLNWVGHEPDSAAMQIERAAAINPPIDLALCSDQMARSARGAYDRHFAKLLFEQLRRSPQWRENSPLARSGRPPRGVLEFDELYTAPVTGFDNAAHYYELASARTIVSRIKVPTLVLAAADDPLIPAVAFAGLPLSSSVRLQVEAGGGHLGFVGRPGDSLPDRHWMDWRLLRWLIVGD
ncbi:MAG: alpha/beta fold hydrolase [Planctomycetaceae bacterium]